MRLEVLDGPEALAERGADVLAQLIRTAVDQRGRAVLAVSGGSTPAAMLSALARRPGPWERVHVVQVDERLAPDGHPDRNLEVLRERLLAAVPGTAPMVHPMSVTADDPEFAAARYAAELARLAGDPPVLDLVQLGLGSDGHTASLVPGDPVLEVNDRDVAVTGRYQGRRRLTCTFPLLARARQRVWLVGGAGKADAVRGVVAGDTTLPAAQVPRTGSLWLVDRAAARELGPAAFGTRSGALATSEQTRGGGRQPTEGPR